MGLVVFAAMCCLVWGLPATAQASLAPTEVQTEPAEQIPGGAKLKGKLNPGGLPTTYYFEYASVTCDEGCTPPKTAKLGPLTGNTQQEVPAVEVTGLTARRYWYHLVASNANGTVEGGLVEFTPGAPLPTVDSESVSHVTSSDATLQARIDPKGDWNGDYYQFQLVKDPSEYAPEIVCPKGPFPQASGCIGIHSESALPIGPVCGSCERMAPWQEVQLDLASAGVTLKPSTTYHYRVITARAVQTEDTIQWEPPPVYGPDQTFTTPPAPPAPVINTVTVSHLTATDATLEAQLNTEDLETSYQFKLAYTHCRECLSPTYSILLPSGLLLGSFGIQTVSLDLNSAGVTLKPGYYEYSLTATSKGGSTQSQWQSFEPPEEAVQPVTITTSPGPQLTTGPAQNVGQGTVTPAATGGSIPAVDAASKPAHGKPSTKHGKRRKHEHHGKRLGKGHKKKH